MPSCVIKYISIYNVTYAISIDWGDDSLREISGTNRWEQINN